jgi:hypothetical protein
MESVINRKGDVTISTVILIVLGLAVLVFLIIGFTQGFDIFFGTIGTVDPGDLEIVAQACKGYVEAGLSISFCEFKKVDVGGDDEWINCKDPRLLNTIGEASKPILKCDENNNVAWFCFKSGKISANNWDKIKVNRVECNKHFEDYDKYEDAKKKYEKELEAES